MFDKPKTQGTGYLLSKITYRYDLYEKTLVNSHKTEQTINRRILEDEIFYFGREGGSGGGGRLSSQSYTLWENRKIFLNYHSYSLSGYSSFFYLTVFPNNNLGKLKAQNHICWFNVVYKLMTVH